MLIHGWGCDKNDARTVGSYEGMENDSLEVLLVFIQWDVLVVKGLRQRSIIRAEEDDLCISAFSPMPRLWKGTQEDVPGIGW